jgi:site-specific DNA recombinase
VQGVIAEYERAKFAERERRGKLYRSRAGEVLSRKVPCGYRRVPRGPAGPAHLIVHEAEAAVVRRIFAGVTGGASVRGIAKALARDGVPSPEGRAVWPLATVGRLLRNEAYLGRLYWNRTATSFDPALGRHRQRRRPPEEWVAIPIPAIVEEETFEAVGQAARDNTAFSPRRTEPDTFLLRRLARCGCCEVKLACHRARREYGPTRYYLCPHHDPVRAGGQDRRCTERRIRADELDAFVFDQVRALLARPELLAAGEAAVAVRAPVPDDELLSAQLARLDRRAQAAQAERQVGVTLARWTWAARSASASAAQCSSSADTRSAASTASGVRVPVSSCPMAWPGSPPGIAAQAGPVLDAVALAHVGGNLLVAGGGGSGRSSAARTGRR